MSKEKIFELSEFQILLLLLVITGKWEDVLKESEIMELERKKEMERINREKDIKKLEDLLWKLGH